MPPYEMFLYLNLICDERNKLIDITVVILL